MVSSVFTIFAVALILLLGCASRTLASNMDAKLEQIANLAAKSKSKVITLDDSTYGYYASQPRSYSLVVTLTAAHPKFKCTICKQVDQEVALVAQAYAESIESKKESPSVFFVRLDYESAQKTFNMYNVNSVPLVFHIAPMTAQSEDSTSLASTIQTKDKFQMPAVVEAEAIASFVRDRTGASVEIKRSMIMSYILLLVVFAILAALVRPVINNLEFWLRLIRIKSIWIVVSIGVYTCAISGLIFDIIRTPPMYHANPQTGQIMFFYPQSGHQFVAEGFVIGFLNVACAVALVCVAQYAPKVKDSTNRNIMMMVGIVAFVFFFRLVRSFYIMKNPWYGRSY